MKCPDCGAQRFYIKDPDDQYNIRDFRIVDEKVEYENNEPDTEHLLVEEETETFCDKCAWHDKFKALR